MEIDKLDDFTQALHNPEILNLMQSMEVFAKELGLSAAAASTYYYTVKG